MILQLPPNLDGLRIRVEIEGEGIRQTMTVSSEITQIKKRFAEEVDEDNLAVNAQFIDNGGKPVGDLIVLKTAVAEPIPTRLDEEVEQMNKVIQVEDQDAAKPEQSDVLDLGPELELESTNEEAPLEDRQEDGVETGASVADESDSVMAEAVDEDSSVEASDEVWDDNDDDDDDDDAYDDDEDDD